MLLSLDYLPFIIPSLLCAPSLVLYSGWRFRACVFIIFIACRLNPFRSSLITLAPLVLTVSITLWFITLIRRFVPYSISHIYYIPSRVPYLLIPLIYILEILSDIVRPVALTVRIVVNLSLRHLFIHLASGVLARILIPFILIFESAVALIQCYIYSSLPSLW